MKLWERARIDRRCGLCGEIIAVGQPMLARWIAGHGWKSIRCEHCAGEPVPELAPLQPLPRAVPMTPIQPMLAVASLARDWKSAAVAEREPGEDG
jgi:hypothetical protein